MGAIVRSFGLTSGYTDFDSKRKSDSHRFEVRRTRHWAVVRKAESMQREYRSFNINIWFGKRVVSAAVRSSQSQL